MLGGLKKHLSPALVISVIALIVAVGGSSFALAVVHTKTIKRVVNAQINKRAPSLSVAHASTADGAPPTGPAGGALAGNYPNPTIQGKAVTTGAIADNAVTTLKIADNVVTTPKIADNAVTTPKIAGNAVTNAKLADNAVSTTKIVDNAVTNSKIIDNAVTSTKIGDGEVKALDLAGTQQVVSASTAIAANGNASVVVACPAGTKALSGGGGASSFLVFNVESFEAGNGWIWVAHNNDAAAHTIFATAVCLNG